MSLDLLDGIGSIPGNMSATRWRMTCWRTDIGLYACAAVLEQDTLAGQCLYQNWTWLEVWGELGLKEIDFISDVPRLLGSVFNHRVMFCIVVSVIVDTLVPEDPKLLLSLSVPEPVVPHIPGLGALLMNIVIDESSGCGVVSLDGGRRLRARVIQTLKEMVDRNGHTYIVCISCRRDYMS